MNIEQLDPARILISLCNQDLEQYDVTFDTLDWKERHSRNVIRELLHYAADVTGINLNQKKLMIEALRYDNGCLLLVTIRESPHRKRYRIRRYHQANAFWFSDLDHFLSCIKALYRFPAIRYPSSAFSDKKGYYLIIHSTEGIQSGYLHTVMEFCSGKVNGKWLPAVLSEHGTVLARKNAIQRIGKELH